MPVPVLADARVEGEVTTNKLRVAETAIQSGTVTFVLDDIGQTQPHGTITAVLHGIRAGVTLQTAEATVTVPQTRQPSAPVSAQVAV